MGIIVDRAQIFKALSSSNISRAEAKERAGEENLLESIYAFFDSKFSDGTVRQALNDRKAQIDKVVDQFFDLQDNFNDKIRDLTVPKRDEFINGKKNEGVGWDQLSSQQQKEHEANAAGQYAKAVSTQVQRAINSIVPTDFDANETNMCFGFDSTTKQIVLRMVDGDRSAAIPVVKVDTSDPAILHALPHHWIGDSPKAALNSKIEATKVTGAFKNDYKQASKDILRGLEFNGVNASARKAHVDQAAITPSEFTDRALDEDQKQQLRRFTDEQLAVTNSFTLDGKKVLTSLSVNNWSALNSADDFQALNKFSDQDLDNLKSFTTEDLKSLNQFDPNNFTQLLTFTAEDLAKLNEFTPRDIATLQTIEPELLAKLKSVDINSLENLLAGTKEQFSIFSKKELGKLKEFQIDDLKKLHALDENVLKKFNKFTSTGLALVHKLIPEKLARLQTFRFEIYTILRTFHATDIPNINALHPDTVRRLNPFTESDISNLRDLKSSLTDQQIVDLFKLDSTLLEIKKINSVVADLKAVIPNVTNEQIDTFLKFYSQQAIPFVGMEGCDTGILLLKSKGTPQLTAVQAPNGRLQLSFSITMQLSDPGGERNFGEFSWATGFLIDVDGLVSDRTCTASKPIVYDSSQLTAQELFAIEDLAENNKDIEEAFIDHALNGGIMDLAKIREKEAAAYRAQQSANQMDFAVFLQRQKAESQFKQSPADLNY